MIIVGDALERLREMSAASAHTCITSPPYWNLRDYGTEGQLGLEARPEEYVEKLVAIMAEVHRVLRDDGTLWLNLGDSYASKARGSDKGWDKSRLTNPGSQQKVQAASLRNFGGERHRGKASGLKEKDLVGIPWMVAFALRAEGWYLRRDIIWSKSNAMPESIRDRPTSSHEYLFMLSKKPRYFYDATAIREADGGVPAGNGYVRPERISGDLGNGNPEPWQPGKGRNKRSVWDIPTQPFPDAHFATFPPKLVEPCILAGTSPKVCEKCGSPWLRVIETTYENPGNRTTNGPRSLERRHETAGFSQRLEKVVATVGWEASCSCESEGGGIATVLDPFAGAGTTGLVAEQLGRDFLGIELKAEYAELAEERIARWRANPHGHLEGDPEPIEGQIGLLE